MKLYNTTTKDVVKITCIDPKSGLDWSGDLIGNAKDEKLVEKYIESEDENLLCGNDEAIDWWTNYAKEYEEADFMVFEFLQKRGDELAPNGTCYNTAYFCDVVCVSEFNDFPSAMKSFVEANK